MALDSISCDQLIYTQGVSGSVPPDANFSRIGINLRKFGDLGPVSSVVPAAENGLF